MKTQIQYAKDGVITSEMRQVATAELVSPEWLRSEIAAGRIVIPKNKHHNFPVRGIGNGLSTKVNANFGTSERHCNMSEELAKMKAAITYGADAVMDLSTGGDLTTILQNVIGSSSVMVGTVPVYGVATRLLREGKPVAEMAVEDLFREIEAQAVMGVDFMTLHCGVTRSSLSFLENDERVTGIVSRGGALLKRWMTVNNCENPLYEQYDRILDVCKKHDVTISLGDGLRPGCGADATDRAQLSELLILGELVDRARDSGVQVMVEGPGHMPLDQIEANMRLMKRVCHNAPFYVLGPLVTDAAPGYDHIVGAIGGTVAAIHGADFLCYVTPAEHLCLPDIDDVRQGVMASRIAAHSADVVNKVKGAAQRDYLLSKARRDLDWEAIYEQALDPHIARERKEASESREEDHCTMCGNLCAVKNDRNID
ncbi:phosphomethylpyrimidine synthase ThiC [Geofilum sp. OHC36d9]|uniref:phosphomethylpyrimidine synthase ThiC n=1 Tax=Geofilum sp. OHC36d9 TaxID=3458413 RepID=UPI004033D7CD